MVIIAVVVRPGAVDIFDDIGDGVVAGSDVVPVVFS